MLQVHYGVVQLDGRWTVISQGLRTNGYASRDAATQAALRLARQPAEMGLTVHLHLQDAYGALRHVRLDS